MGAKIPLIHGNSPYMAADNLSKVTGMSNPTHIDDLDDMADSDHLNEFVLNVEIPDISTGQSVFVVSPYAATIDKVYTTIQNAISVADAGISLEIAGVAVTDGSLTIAYDGSAAGDVDSATPSALNVVTAGQAIEVITDGASTTACVCNVTLKMTRTA